MRTEPEPEALLVRFGENSAEFQLRVWTDEPHWVRVRSDLGVAIQRALRAERAGEEGEREPRQSVK